MSSSTTRCLPGLAGRMEPRTQALEDRTASPRDRGISSPQFAGNIGTAQSLSDEALIALICGGDSEAFAGLFRRYASVVRGVALRVLKDPSEAEDLLQDIFILIHHQCGTFDSSKGSAQFWILQMTYRRAISRRRYLNSRHFYKQVELDEQSFEGAEPRSGHSGDQVDSILAELDLQKMFGTLSEDQQQTLRLHFIEGYTLDEIAKMLGQTKGNIRHHSLSGLERLRKLIFAGKFPGARAV
jgi:RNA polymerase sigma-70 factor (ECF subfamily)